MQSIFNFFRAYRCFGFGLGVSLEVVDRNLKKPSQGLGLIVKMTTQAVGSQEKPAGAEGCPPVRISDTRIPHAEDPSGVKATLSSPASELLALIDRVRSRR